MTAALPADRSSASMILFHGTEEPSTDERTEAIQLQAA